MEVHISIVQYMDEVRIQILVSTYQDKIYNSSLRYTSL